MTAVPAAPGVLRRRLTVEQVLDRIWAMWERHCQDSFNEFRDDGVRGFTREEVLQQFTNKARRLAR